MCVSEEGGGGGGGGVCSRVVGVWVCRVHTTKNRLGP